MSRLPLLAALLAVAGCPSGDDASGETDAPTGGETAILETGLYVDTDTGAWWPNPNDTDGPDTDVSFDTDTGLETDALDTDAVDTDVPPCDTPGWIRDCIGECYAPTIVGNGFCDQGPAPKANFDCPDFEYDGGDCVVDTAPDTDTDACPFGSIPDCNDLCVSGFLLGDGTCQDGTGAGGIDFSCVALNFDDGDCAPDTDIETDLPLDTDIVDSGIDTDAISEPCSIRDFVRDCNGRCYYQGWIGDGQCDAGRPAPFGRPDFACLLHDFDGGDCAQP